MQPADYVPSPLCRAPRSRWCEMSTGEPDHVPEPEMAEEPDLAEESDSVQADSVQGGEEQEAAESEVAESEVAESPFPVQTLKFDTPATHQRHASDTPAQADDGADEIVNTIMAGVPEEEAEDADGDAAAGEAEGDGDANGDEASPSREVEGAGGDAESPADASEMPNLPKRATPAFSFFLREKFASRPSREAGDAWTNPDLDPDLDPDPDPSPSPKPSPNPNPSPSPNPAPNAGLALPAVVRRPAGERGACP